MVGATAVASSSLHALPVPVETPGAAMSSPREGAGAGPAPSVRIDKWLWAARIYKTRSQAAQAVESGQVLLVGDRVKPARALRAGDELTVRIGDVRRTLIVLALSDRRGPALVAQALYEETAESLEQARLERERRRLDAAPEEMLRGRPTKRDRRSIGRIRGR
jgi:ribosome-associated heat shock protein Hsp15